MSMFWHRVANVELSHREKFRLSYARTPLLKPELERIGRPKLPLDWSHVCVAGSLVQETRSNEDQKNIRLSARAAEIAGRGMARASASRPSVSRRSAVSA